jgi:hypothetical protein
VSLRFSRQTSMGPCKVVHGHACRIDTSEYTRLSFRSGSEYIYTFAIVFRPNVTGDRGHELNNFAQPSPGKAPTISVYSLSQKVTGNAFIVIDYVHWAGPPTIHRYLRILPGDMPTCFGNLSSLAPARATERSIMLMAIMSFVGHKKD